MIDKYYNLLEWNFSEFIQEIKIKNILLDIIRINL
jgi:hypothetical protein